MPFTSGWKSSGGGGGGGSTISATFTASGDIPDSGGTENFQASTFPARGVIDFASFQGTSGDASFCSLLLFEGEPGNGGTFYAGIFGGEFSGTDASSEKIGPRPSVSGTEILLTIPFALADPWIQMKNSAGSAMQATATLFVREVTA